MDRRRRRLDQALPLNRNLADNVLSGALPPDDLPPALGPMAKLVDALRPGPQTADVPPSGRDGLTVEAMTSFLTASARHPAKWRGSAAGRAIPRRVAGFRIRLATAMVAAGLAFLVGAAYAGRLPAPAQNAVSVVLSKVGLSVPHDAGDETSEDSDQRGGAGAVGPDANGPAHDGLCNAYFNGNGGSEGGKLDSVAFRNIRQAAADAGQSVEEFCGVDPATPDAKDHGKDHEGKDKDPHPSHGASDDQPGSDGHGKKDSGKDHVSQGAGDDAGSEQGPGSVSGNGEGA